VLNIKAMHGRSIYDGVGIYIQSVPYFQLLVKVKLVQNVCGKRGGKRGTDVAKVVPMWQKWHQCGGQELCGKRKLIANKGTPP
jgi:hypothetical protein